MEAKKPKHRKKAYRRKQSKRTGPSGLIQNPIWNATRENIKDSKYLEGSRRVTRSLRGSQPSKSNNSGSGTGHTSPGEVRSGYGSMDELKLSSGGELDWATAESEGEEIRYPNEEQEKVSSGINSDQRPRHERLSRERYTGTPEESEGTKHTQNVSSFDNAQDDGIQSLEAKNDTIIKTLEAMNVRLKKLDVLENITLNLKGEVSQVRTRIEDVSANLNTVRSDLDKYEEKWQEVSKNLAGRLSVLEKSSKSMENKWDLYRESVSKDLKVLQSSIDSNSKQVLESEADIKLYKDKMDSLEKLEEKIKNAAEKKFNAIKTAVKREIGEEILEEVRARPSEVTYEDLSEMKEEIKKEISKEISDSKSDTASLPEVTREEISDLKKVVTDLQQAQDNNAPREKEQGSLVGQAFAKRHNLLVFGIRDCNSAINDFTTIGEFFANQMGLRGLKIQVVYRLGHFHPGSPIPRPLVVKFVDIKDRWLVWNNKSKIRFDAKAPVRIQEDIPKKLRDDLRVLQRIAQTARQKPEVYNEVRIKDYSLIINGVNYEREDVHKLPTELQPEAVYSPRDKEAVVFFTKQSPFSNHFCSPLSIEGRDFACVEQFLAYEKAKLANNTTLMNRALEQTDPSACKVILNTLRGEIQERWEKKAPTIILPAIRAKFQQNERLANLLVETYPLAIGEASRDSIWGTGLTLEHKDTMNVAKWEHRGNLLGYTLEKVRDEIMKDLRVRVNPSRKATPGPGSVEPSEPSQAEG